MNDFKEGLERRQMKLQNEAEDRKNPPKVMPSWQKALYGTGCFFAIIVILAVFVGGIAFWARLIFRV